MLDFCKDNARIMLDFYKDYARIMLDRVDCTISLSLVITT